MSIRFVDSFSWSSVPASIKYVFSPGAGPLLTAGRYTGNALLIENTGFGQFQMTRAVAVMPTWCFSCSFRPTDGGGGSTFVASDWLYLDGHSDPSTMVNILRASMQTSGKMKFSTGAGLIAETPALTLRQWISLEIVATFGASGTLDVYIDDVRVIHATSIGWDYPQYPDQFRLYWSHFGQQGYSLCDLAVADASIGPVRVCASYPISDAQVGDWTGNGGTTQTSRVQDHPINQSPTPAAPDDNVTYTQSGTAAAKDLFTMLAFPCFGRNIAIAPAVVAMGTPGGQVALVVRPDPTSLTIDAVGAPQAIPSGPYAIYQVIAESPYWPDGAIGEAYWGFRLESGNARVTQYLIEKVTTLRALPYDCGGVGSYSY